MTGKNRKSIVSLIESKCKENKFFSSLNSIGMGIELPLELDFSIDPEHILFLMGFPEEFGTCYYTEFEVAEDEAGSNDPDAIYDYLVLRIAEIKSALSSTANGEAI